MPKDDWPDWRTAGGITRLHYAGAVRVSVTETPDGWKVQFPGGYTFEKTLAAAKANAENQVACDAALPPVPEQRTAAWDRLRALRDKK